jgi:hypothetical protein
MSAHVRGKFRLLWKHGAGRGISVIMGLVCIRERSGKRYIRNHGQALYLYIMLNKYSMQPYIPYYVSRA